MKYSLMNLLADAAAQLQDGIQPQQVAENLHPAMKPCSLCLECGSMLHSSQRAKQSGHDG